MWALVRRTYYLAIERHDLRIYPIMVAAKKQSEPSSAITKHFFKTGHTVNLNVASLDI